MSIPADALERVRSERDELGDRFAKLTSFMSGVVFAEQLEPEDRALLSQQHAAMREYLRVLEARIARAGVA